MQTRSYREMHIVENGPIRIQPTLGYTTVTSRFNSAVIRSADERKILRGRRGMPGCRPRVEAVYDTLSPNVTILNKNICSPIDQRETMGDLGCKAAG
ncbi:hypothetical protein J6590_034165 [Homalodisca vitripennis]|nr:hypothetical protein J6590_034165 [Homalodisca vitripennis]